MLGGLPRVVLPQVNVLSAKLGVILLLLCMIFVGMCTVWRYRAMV